MKYALTALMVAAMALGIYAQFVGAVELRQACTDVFILSALLVQGLRISSLEKTRRNGTYWSERK